MDYEKKYNEALSQARFYYGNCPTEPEKKKLEKLFPELRESEDEKIVREMLEYFTITRQSDFCSRPDRQAWIAWLEKQKEQKQEIKYVYPKFRKGDVIEPITPNGHYTPVRVIAIYDGSYSCRSDDNKAYLSLPIKREDEYRLVEQKPVKNVIKEITKDKDSALKFLKSAGIMNENGELAEMYRSEQKYMKWSEKDEEHLRSIESTIECAKAQFPNSPAAIEAYNEDLSWLHSFLPPQKAEWSEEDEKFFITALWHISYSVSNGKSTDCRCDTTEWLKSIKERLKSLRPPFKPSEEQMDTIELRNEIDRYIEYMYNGRFEKGSEEYIMLDKCARHFINWTRNAPHETTKTE